MIHNRALWKVMLLQLLAATFCERPALAAELKEVQSFGDNPSNTRMFIYVPDKLAASPPILVAIHYCTGSAQAFFDGTTYHSQADRHGFIVIYPETTASDHCFDVHSPETLKHDGGGESAAIAAMVRYTLREYKANTQRVYVTGTSSGAMMTNVMLGAYPDLFRAGAAFAGVPFGCFAGPDRWNGDCANGRITKTAQEWGDLVRAAYPDYTGPRPRMQLWHGDKDETLSFHNFGEEIKQWTNVLGVSEMPTSTDQNAPQSGWTRARYADSSGAVQVEAMVGSGMPHNLKVLSDEAVVFFGLDAESDPRDAAAGSGGVAAVGGMGGAHAASAAGTSGAKAAVGGMPASVSAGAGAGAGGQAALAPAAPAGGTSAPASAAAASNMRTLSPTVAAGHAATGSNTMAVSMQPAAAPADSTRKASTCSLATHPNAKPSPTWLLLCLAGLLRACRRSRPVPCPASKPRKTASGCSSQ